MSQETLITLEELRGHWEGFYPSAGEWVGASESVEWALLSKLDLFRANFYCWWQGQVE